jgi:hypothetical protein
MNMEEEKMQVPENMTSRDHLNRITSNQIDAFLKTTSIDCRAIIAVTMQYSAYMVASCCHFQCQHPFTNDSPFTNNSLAILPSKLLLWRFLCNFIDAGGKGSEQHAQRETHDLELVSHGVNLCELFSPV